MVEGHYIKKCRQCGIVISQCRCPNPNKELILGICDACKKKDEPINFFIDKIKTMKKVDMCDMGMTEERRIEKAEIVGYNTAIDDIINVLGVKQ